MLTCAPQKESLPKWWHFLECDLDWTIYQRKHPHTQKLQLHKRRRPNYCHSQEKYSNQTRHWQWPSWHLHRRRSCTSLRTQSGQGKSSMWAARTQLDEAINRMKYEQMTQENKHKLSANLTSHLLICCGRTIKPEKKLLIPMKMLAKIWAVPGPLTKHMKSWPIEGDSKAGKNGGKRWNGMHRITQ